MPRLPPYLTDVRVTTDAPSSSESISYDYSGQDEMLKRRDEAGQLAAGRYKQLYDGDVAGSVSSGQRIRSLIASLNDIQPVRVSSTSSSQNMGGGTTSISGQHDEPKQQSPSYVNTQTAAQRARTMSNAIAGNPQGIGNNGRPIDKIYG